MKLFTSITEKQYSFKRVTRVGLWSLGIGVLLGGYGIVTITPIVKTAYANIQDALTDEVTYTASTTPTIIEQQNDRVELYFEEEFTKLEAKYEQKRKDEALMNAMERVEEEFETQKEEIRARELLH